jgi:hypothetical protein
MARQVNYEYSYQVDSLLGGVSQQAPSVRKPDQCAALDNAYINLTDGLHKRVPTEHLAQAYTNATIPANGAKLHTIDRGTGEQIVVILTNGAIKAYDAVTGAAITVSDPSGYIASYCATTLPEQRLKAVTVQDTTYILNTEKIVAKDLVNYVPMVSSTLAKEGYIFVRAANYNQTYTVKINGATGAPYTATYTTTTWDGTKNTGVQGPGGAGTLVPTAPYVGVSTEGIAEDLKNKINLGTGGIHGITATRYGSVIQLVRGSAAANNFDSITVEDSVGNTSLNLFYNEISQAENFLPDICRDGFRIKVVGDDDRDIDDHYVEFVGNRNDSLTVGSGYWRESAKQTPYHTPPSSSLIEYDRLDPSTMPHKMTYGSGVLTVERITWDIRAVGDQSINPFPSFLGKTITDLFFFQDRLGFVSEDNIVMSEQGYYYNFFRTTNRNLIDTDRIDVAVSGTKVVKINHAVPFSQYLLLISDRSQHILRGQDVLSPRTVTIIPTTEFTSLQHAPPVASGRSVFLADQISAFGTVREYLQIDANEVFDAFDISNTVPAYISGTIKQMSASTNHDVLTLITDDKNYVYVYKYTWAGSQKIVSAWMRWEFNGGQIWGVSWIKDWLILMIKRDQGLYIERLNPTAGRTDSGLSFLTRLDRKATQAACSEAYSSVTNLTQITLPYAKDPSATIMLVDNTGQRHLEVITGSTTSTIRFFRGDFSATPYTIGQIYTMTYDPGEPILKSRTQDGYAVVASGPMKVRRGRLRYKDTRAIEVQVTVDSRETFTYNYEVPQTNYTLTNSIVLRDGEYEFPVMGQADTVSIQILNATAYPSNMVSMSYGIMYRPKEQAWR